jgi:hypothetical protein
MIVFNKEGREIEIDRIGGESSDDIYVIDAVYVDNGEDVSDDDLYYIEQKYATEISESWFQSMISRAESFYEGDR